MDPRAAVSSHETVHWGVDSWGPADGRVDGTTKLELVTRRMARAPAFWGRYLNRRLPHAVTAGEVQFLHDNGCRVLLVYNDSPGREERLRGGLRAGREAAEHADAMCELLQVPRHVAIYGDIENWPGDVG